MSIERSTPLDYGKNLRKRLNPIRLKLRLAAPKSPSNTLAEEHKRASNVGFASAPGTRRSELSDITVAGARVYRTKFLRTA